MSVEGDSDANAEEEDPPPCIGGGSATAAVEKCRDTAGRAFGRPDGPSEDSKSEKSDSDSVVSIEDDVDERVAEECAVGPFFFRMPSWMGYVNALQNLCSPNERSENDSGNSPTAGAAASHKGVSSAVVGQPRRVPVQARPTALQTQALRPRQAAASPPVGLLGVPAPPRARQAPLAAIRELPPQYDSATYDELRAPSAREREGENSGRPFPDPMALGLVLDREITSARGGSTSSRVLAGHIGGPDRGTAVLVTELALPRPIDGTQLRMFSAGLRASALARDDLCMPLGAVPGGRGVWVAWSDAVGACAAEESGCALPLAEALRKEPAFGPRWRLAVARQLCVALVALHDAGRSHGSVAPRSIWVTQRGDLGVMEAGLVDALLGAGVLREPRELFACLGLEFAKYSAPEAWQVPRKVGPPADIWALGLVLLEILGGASPCNHECTTLEQLRAKVPSMGTQTPHIRAGCLLSKLPTVARRAIAACLNPLPSARPEAQQVLFTLAAPADDAPNDMSSLISGPLTVRSSQLQVQRRGQLLRQGSNEQRLPPQRGAIRPLHAQYEESSAETFVPAPRRKSWLRSTPAAESSAQQRLAAATRERGPSMSLLRTSPSTTTGGSAPSRVLRVRRVPELSLSVVAGVTTGQALQDGHGAHGPHAPSLPGPPLPGLFGGSSHWHAFGNPRECATVAFAYAGGATNDDLPMTVNEWARPSCTYLWTTHGQHPT